MKIEYNSRAARYLKLRLASPHMTATRAWQLAERDGESYVTSTRYHWVNPAEHLRYVGRVIPESGHNWEDKREDCGWHTDPYGDVFRDGTGLCYGVIYQLPGRRGESRYLAGYEFGGIDGGPSLDLSTVYAIRDEPDSDAGAYHSGAVHAADAMAKDAAEKEREWQTAWQAGLQWRGALDNERKTRSDTLALLRENRLSGGYRDLPATRDAIRRAVRDAWSDICESRAKRRELAQGNADPLWFYAGDDDAQTAFCEGAGLDVMPTRHRFPEQ